jgi:hypothetical protein
MLGITATCDQHQQRDSCVFPWYGLGRYGIACARRSEWLHEGEELGALAESQANRNAAVAAMRSVASCLGTRHTKVRRMRLIANLLSTPSWRRLGVCSLFVWPPSLKE